MATRPPERRHEEERRRSRTGDIHERLEDKRLDIEHERRQRQRRATDRAALALDTLVATGMRLEPAHGQRHRRGATLLWQLSSETHPAIECLAVRLQTGRTLVDVVRVREQAVSGIFSDAQAAVRWALALERSLLANGWSKTI